MYVGMRLVTTEVFAVSAAPIRIGGTVPVS
jgi:hypothetical protein